MNLQQQRIAEMCEQLKLVQLASGWPGLAQDAARDDASFADFLEKVLASELTARDERRVATLTKLATMPAVKTMEQFDWTHAPGAPKAQIQELEADAGRAKDHATKQRALGVLVNGRELVCAVQVIKHDKRFALVMGVEPVQDLSSPLAVNPFWNASPGVSCMQVLSDELEAASNQHHHHLFTGQVFAPSAADHVLRAL